MVQLWLKRQKFSRFLAGFIIVMTLCFTSTVALSQSAGNPDSRTRSPGRYVLRQESDVVTLKRPPFGETLSSGADAKDGDWFEVWATTDQGFHLRSRALKTHSVQLLEVTDQARVVYRLLGHKFWRSEGEPDVPGLVRVYHRAPGSHGRISLLVFKSSQVGSRRTFQELVRIESPVGSPLVTRGTKGSLVVNVRDSALSYWPNGFVGSPAPALVFELRGDSGARLMTEALRRPRLTEAEMTQRVRAIAAERWGDGVGCEVLWHEMSAIAYGGNLDQAIELCRRSWPHNDQSRERFLQTFIERVKRSPAFVQLNKGR